METGTRAANAHEPKKEFEATFITALAGVEHTLSILRRTISDITIDFLRPSPREPTFADLRHRP
jgi:hypothetical protein